MQTSQRESLRQPYLPKRTCARRGWVATKELNSSYNNSETILFQIIWFLNYGNLNEVPIISLLWQFNLSSSTATQEGFSSSLGLRRRLGGLLLSAFRLLLVADLLINTYIFFFICIYGR